jgi:hypothetical protein
MRHGPQRESTCGFHDDWAVCQPQGCFGFDVRHSGFIGKVSADRQGG